MEKVAAAVLTLFVVLPMIAADKPLVMPKTRLIPAEPITDGVQIIICPNQSVSCNDTQACCSYYVGGYYCCPLPGGNCCFNYTTCCPSGYVCDNINNKCVKASISGDVLEKSSFLK